ncbi:HD domain-containing protein [Ruania halotolerans]|uniref:HD domain-containing protein n=1 Tax=Ruania halotolerans TaxID=2897773 RepID=UPI001E35DBAB|nr:hypothetical protein [Ruania halotolerans]UFU07225.1 hypothetical protein LQF10_03695 [Ruania halotolerans]
MSAMGVIDAPGWVLSAWRRSLEAVGATADRATLETYGERLIKRWSDPSRIHHNLKRLIGVLARVDELAPETHDPDVVRIAAWYHGAAFDAAARQAYAHRGGVDEVASAELARRELSELGVPAKVVDRVSALIIGIARHSAPKNDIDAQALCDADLGGLAAEPQRYQAYRREVREEYRHIPDRDYVEARLAIVTKLLNRNRLFKSPMAQPWEDAARENLSAELDRLTSTLEQLPPRDESDPRGDAADQGAREHAGSAGDGPEPEADRRQDPALRTRSNAAAGSVAAGNSSAPARSARSDEEGSSDQAGENTDQADSGTRGSAPAADAGPSEDAERKRQPEDRTDDETQERSASNRDVPSLSRPPRMPAIKHHPVTRRR